MTHLDLEVGKEVLLLNSDYTPINVCSWKRAVVLFLKGRVQIVSSRTIRLLELVRLPYRLLMGLKPTKKMVQKHYDHRCVYCGSLNNLTIDHVLPISRGGKNTWENLVCACYSCNIRKGDKTPQEVGLRLYIKSFRPFNKMHLLIERSNVEEWKSFIFS
jgi:5-methylcytosine-specific restriction endonuclease McrA